MAIDLSDKLRATIDLRSIGNKSVKVTSDEFEDEFTESSSSIDASKIPDPNDYEEI